MAEIEAAVQDALKDRDAKIDMLTRQVEMLTTELSKARTAGAGSSARLPGRGDVLGAAFAPSGALTSRGRAASPGRIKMPGAASPRGGSTTARAASPIRRNSAGQVALRLAPSTAWIPYHARLRHSCHSIS